MQGKETSFQITIIKEKLKNTIEKILEITETYYKKKVLPTLFCPTGQYGKPSHIAY
tara:strand:- start:88 stop:255 length:168 start_codon:yes stop_codon:yes gene_type:complete